jgi:hypothetical protein
MSEDICPKCGKPYDTEKDDIIICPRCDQAGATNCCNPGGRNCICLDCEESN